MNTRHQPSFFSAWRRCTLAFLCLAIVVTAPSAQQQTTNAASEDRANLYQALLDLANPWTVMCVAAHPDDEDGSSLIVMRRKFGAHTVSLFSTFGEGGQNAIGPELYEEMGAIRARETMAAAEIQGSEPHFLGLKDFGYSKSADEAFKFWGHDEALRRMVLQIRKLRPDVIITNHSATSNDHGHHQATARLVVEAFDAAADPKQFPDQLKDGVSTWQVQRLFVRARGNQSQTDNSPVVTIDPNERDPIRDTVYAEEALRALQKHATQGPWPKTFADMVRGRGQDGKMPVIRYRLTREAKGADALSTASHNFLDGLRLPENITKELQSPTIDGRPLTEFVDQREKLVHALAIDKDRVGRPLASNDFAIGSDARDRLLYHLGRIQSALLSAAGITTKLSAGNSIIPGAVANFSFTISNNGPQAIQLERLSWPAGPATPNIVTVPCCPNSFSNRSIRPGESVEIPLTFATPKNAALTVPHGIHLYEETGLGLTAITYAFSRVNDTNVIISASTTVDVVPAVEVAEVTPSLLGVSPDKVSDKSRFPFTVTLINHRSVPVNGKLIGDDVFGNPIDTMAVTLAAGEKKTVKFPVTQPLAGGKRNSLTFLVQGAKLSSSQMGVPVFSTEAHVSPNLRVGYIRGFDYSLPNALAALGVESKELSVDDLKTADLQKYTTIIVDNRVYESQPELIAVNQRLLDFAKDGGTLIAFYHKSDEWNPNPQRNRPQLAPYKLILGNERITDENAPITFLEADHPLLDVPNKLTQDDFKDWIQERGLYYPREWDPQFHALLQSNDPGEAPLKGGLLVADYGRGHYIYTSMVWYRELRGGLPGAYRMLANMISYGH